MSNPLSVNDIIRCRIWVETTIGGGQASVNTLHYFVSAVGGSPATDLDVAETLDTIVAPEMKAIMPAAGVYHGVQAQVLDQNPPYHAKFVEAFTIASQGAGTVAGLALPGQTCGLISFESNFAGVAFRGRFYAPFPGVDDDAGLGVPTAGYVTRLTTLATSVASGLTPAIGGRTATLVRIILHGENKVGATPPPSPITQARASGLWATQRRRGGYGRQNRSPI